jgi:hypothetical protein
MSIRVLSKVACCLDGALIRTVTGIRCFEAGDRILSIGGGGTTFGILWNFVSFRLDGAIVVYFSGWVTVVLFWDG